MQYLSKTLGIVLVLAIVGGLAIGAYYGGRWILSPFSRLEFQFAIVAAIGAVTVLLGATILAGSIRKAGKSVTDARLHAGKAEAYLAFMEVWEGLLKSGEDPEDWNISSPEMQKLSHLLLLHGSPAVLKAHTQMQDLALPEARERFGVTLIEIRADLGLRSGGLLPEELTELLLTEPDNQPLTSRPVSHQDSRPRIKLPRKSS